MSNDNSDDTIDKIVDYTPSPRLSNKKDVDNNNSNKETAEKKKIVNLNTEDDNNKSHSEILMDLANQNFDLLFKDQYGEGFVRILNNVHKEIIPINSSKFAEVPFENIL